jgi:uncharacterized protein (DUF1778 family)
MVKTAKRDRLTIDLSPEEHRKIKAYAAYQGKTLKEFVVESIRIKMALDSEQEDLNMIMTKPTELMMEIWDNDMDAAYDKL